ncbi:MAG: hypothetical protein WDW38_008688 [Sanguina aurantia]
MEPSDFLSLDTDAAVGRPFARMTAGETNLGVELALFGLVFAAGGIGLATESATLTVITFVAGLLLWLYSTMASVSLQSWADDQHAKSLAAKQLKEAAKTTASSSTRQQTSDATTTSKPVPGSTTAVPGGPSPRQLECLLEQVQRQRSGGGGVCGVAPTRAEVEAVLRAGRCSPVTAEDGALCRLTVMLSPASVASFTHHHCGTTSQDQDQRSPAASESSDPASCCYILLHTSPQPSPPGASAARLNLGVASMAHTMLLMSTAMGLQGEWVGASKEGTAGKLASHNVLQLDAGDQWFACLKLSKRSDGGSSGGAITHSSDGVQSSTSTAWL